MFNDTAVLESDQDTVMQSAFGHGDNCAYMLVYGRVATLVPDEVATKAGR